MALTNQEILDAIAEKSVMEIVDLISAMEEKFGVSAAAVAVAAAVAAVPINSVVSDMQAVMCSTGCRQPRA